MPHSFCVLLPLFTLLQAGIFGVKSGVTPSPFVAPEVLCGEGFSAAADTYSLAATICELATGERVSHGLPEVQRISWKPFAHLLKRHVFCRGRVDEG